VGGVEKLPIFLIPLYVLSVEYSIVNTARSVIRHYVRGAVNLQPMGFIATTIYYPDARVTGTLSALLLITMVGNVIAAERQN
jgi:hypothetical protein